MSNIQYTLYAKQGKLFRAKTHYLYIGSWLLLDITEYVILKHGVMSRSEYNHICSKTKIPIYEYSPVSWTDIFPYHATGFFCYQKIGILNKSKERNLWKGVLFHGNWK